MLRVVLTLRFLTLLFLMGSSGCATLAVHRSSVPEAPEAEAQRFERSGFLFLVMGAADGAELDLEALELRLITRIIGGELQRVAMGPLLPILPFPAAWWTSQPTEAFYLEVQLTPKEPISFSPSEVTLVESDGSELRPTGYLGPVYPENIGTFYSWESDIATVFVPPGRPSCFVLAFERPPPRSWNFAVDLRGIRTTGVPVEVPRFEFHKRSKWFLHWGGGSYFCAG